ncbi:MAG: serpin family protein [Clostridia bacterium]|nr:serpin family protein [Clostridia bacterium]
MKKVLSLCMILVLLFSLVACGETETPADSSNNGAQTLGPAGTVSGYRDISSLPGMMDFSHALLNACAEEGENLLLSPLSVNIALSMAANGAEGETLEQMKTFLADGREMEAWNGLLMGYVQKLMERKNSRLHMANAVLSKEGNVTLTDTFSETLRTKYGAQIASRPFNEETLHLLNDWVNTNTDGMIPSLLDRFDEETVLLLVNVLLLEAVWEYPRTEKSLSDGIFTAADGSRQDVTMMSSSNYVFYQWQQAIGTGLSLQDGYSMVVILPEEGKTPEEVLAQMSSAELNKGLDNPKRAQVTVELPKFSMEYETDLKDVLTALGLQKAFEGGDFSPMGSSEDGPLALQKVIHKTALELDEKGIKAAGLTADLVCGSGMPPTEKREVILDRPFAFMILGTGNVPIFAGIVNSIDQ